MNKCAGPKAAIKHSDQTMTVIHAKLAYMIDFKKIPVCISRSMFNCLALRCFADSTRKQMDEVVLWSLQFVKQKVGPT